MVAGLGDAKSRHSVERVVAEEPHALQAGGVGCPCRAQRLRTQRGHGLVHVERIDAAEQGEQVLRDSRPRTGRRCRSAGVDP